MWYDGMTDTSTKNAKAASIILNPCMLSKFHILLTHRMLTIQVMCEEFP